MTYGEAVHLTRLDYDRLRHLHTPSWSVDIECRTVWFRCSCDDTARNANAQIEHILSEVRAVRGPVKK